ncbi:MAG TPA: c-type cytochrome [Gemmatimonadaceae bacterium]
MGQERKRHRVVALVLAALAGTVLLAACHDEPYRVVPGGDPAQGKKDIAAYGCGSCHTIPGITNANGTVGPPLLFWGRRSIIAGEVPNTPDWLIRWIEMPQAIEPGTDMPNLGVTEGEAKNIAAYLYTLH